MIYNTHSGSKLETKNLNNSQIKGNQNEIAEKRFKFEW